MNSQFLKVTLDQNGTLLDGQHRLAAIAKMYTQTEWITPEIAAQYLERNYEGQRKLRSHHVSEIANEIKSGEWRLTHQGLAFSPDGTLLDGQHRLAAIVQAGVAVPMNVSRNVPEGNFEKIDQLAAGRTVTDHLTWLGIPQVTLVAATARLCMTYLDNKGLRRVCRINTYSPKDIERFLIANPSIAKNASFARHTLSDLMQGSYAGFIHFILGQVDETDRDDFIDKLSSGAGLDEGDPRLQLRDRLRANRAARDKMPAYAVFSLIFKAWNMWRNGETRKRLIFLSCEEMQTPE